jgi:peptide/nickel transport system permease protein
MSRYLVRRLLFVIPTLWLAGSLVFFLARMVPGDPADQIIGQGNFTQEDKEQLREALGLKDPILESYVSWWGDLVQGDLGRSVIDKLEIAPQIKQKLPVSIELGVLATFWSVVIGLPIGILAALRRNTAEDYLARCISIGFLSVPGFWIATLVIAIGSAELGWAPNFVYVPLVDDPVENIKQFMIPAVIMGLASSAVLMRMTRAMILDVLRQDYVRAAQAKGVHGRMLVLRHVLPNALIPVVTIVGLSLANIIGGSVIFERIFNLPGLGNFLVTAVSNRDYPAIQSVVLVIAVLVIVVNLLVDLSYALLDPRIRYD